MRTSRAEYLKHQAKFLALHKFNNKLTVADYCRGEGLNYESARRYIKSPSNKQIRQRVEYERLYAEFHQRIILEPNLSLSIFAKEKQLQLDALQDGFIEIAKSLAIKLDVARATENDEPLYQAKYNNLMLNRAMNTLLHKVEWLYSNGYSLLDAEDKPIPKSHLDLLILLGMADACNKSAETIYKMVNNKNRTIVRTAYLAMAKHKFLNKSALKALDEVIVIAVENKLNLLEVVQLIEAKGIKAPTQISAKALMILEDKFKKTKNPS